MEIVIQAMRRREKISSWSTVAAKGGRKAVRRGHEGMAPNWDCRRRLSPSMFSPPLVVCLVTSDRHKVQSLLQWGVRIGDSFRGLLDFLSLRGIGGCQAVHLASPRYRLGTGSEWHGVIGSDICRCGGWNELLSFASPTLTSAASVADPICSAQSQCVKAPVPSTTR